MSLKNIFIFSFPVLALFTAGFFYFTKRQADTPGTANTVVPDQTESSETAMANPASVNCLDKGGKLDIRKDSQGGESGFCIFQDGHECEEWAFFRGECASESAHMKPSSDTVPLPTGEDVISLFVNLVNENRVVEAVDMLETSLTADDSEKQSWGVQFNSFSALALSEIQKTQATDDSESYRVSLDAKMKPEAALAPIPYYGWNDGENTRWITIKKIGSIWKITAIATGP